MNSNIPNITLNNGVEIPQVGLGVWKAAEGGEVENAVRTAIDAGYRLIDTAAAYSNESGVGRGLKQSGVPREELFVTTKLWNAHHDYDDALRAFDESLAKLDCDYIDLYLIHWPLPMEGKFTQAWQALETIYNDKRARAIGVSNFTPQHLEILRENSDIVPAVNQIELHPKLTQQETRDYCEPHGIVIEAYSPLMRGGEILEHPTIADLAAKHGKKPAQIVLRWHVQNGLVVIPKSVHPDRIRDNISLFDFELSPDELQQIDALNDNTRLAPDPNTASFK